MNKSKIMARAYLLTESNRILHKDGGDNGHDGQVRRMKIIGILLILIELILCMLKYKL